MAENSKIEWTDNTFNPWMGCTKVSPACKNCYAERDMDHRYGKVAWGPKGSRVVTSDDNWKKPIKWNREADALSIRTRVFCASLADVFEDWQGPMSKSNGAQLFNDRTNGKHWDQTENIVGMGEGAVTMNDVRARLFALIEATPSIDWLLLTKRPENIAKMWPASGDGHKRFKNIWLGTSVESSEYLHRIDSLKACGLLASVLFISAEPIVGPMPTIGEHLDGIDWVIAGGESGPNARPSHPDWFRSMRDQCATLEIPFHFKQWGEWIPGGGGGRLSVKQESVTIGVDGRPKFPGDANLKEFGFVRMNRVGKQSAGRILDGEIHDGVPLLYAV